MKTYKKGSRAERELINLFSKNNWCVIRAAGSGSNSLSPDILAFKKGNQIAIEVKAHEKDYLHIRSEQINLLKRWEEISGITTYIGWRRNREEWVFLSLRMLKSNEKGAGIKWEDAKEIGFKIDYLLG